MGDRGRSAEFIPLHRSKTMCAAIFPECVESGDEAVPHLRALAGPRSAARRHFQPVTATFRNIWCINDFACGGAFGKYTPEWIRGQADRLGVGAPGAPAAMRSE